MTSCLQPSNLQNPILFNQLSHQAKVRSKESLKFFCRYATDEFWQPYNHLDYLCDVLEKVARKEIRRLILNMPPQHGKSYTTSELFPVWYLGNHPNNRIILTSYGADLASGFSENARNLFRTQGLDIWDLALSDSSQAKDEDNFLEMLPNLWQHLGQSRSCMSTSFWERHNWRITISLS